GAIRTKTSAHARRASAEVARGAGASYRIARMLGPTLIVGAGPGGLAAARAFKLFGVPYVHVERHRDVGGIWDADNAGTSIYESAHFISSKTCSAFHGMPMPDAYPDYPGRAQILAYLRAFADAFDLRATVRFGTEVTAATPLAGGGWRVAFADGR